MQAIVSDLIKYIKNPNCEKAQIPLVKKITLLLKLLLISFIISITLGILISFLAEFGLFKMDTHAMSKLLQEKSKIEIVLMVVLAAPILEELIFRAPLTLFCNRKHFKYVFYAFAILFGFIHILNYEVTIAILLLSPILIAPQIILGLLLGYTRIKLGLLYAIALHMLFNGILLVPSLLFFEN